MGEPTLAEFLLARIAEDRAAYAAVDDVAHVAGPVHAEHAFVYLTDPVRAAADTEARRLIVEAHPIDYAWHADRFVEVCSTCRPVGPCRTLRLMAAAYVDHPDYREVWTP